MAPRDVMAGEDWDKAIMDAIPVCRVVVIIFSAKSNDSPYCISEIRTAFDLKKEILPILIDDTLPHGRPTVTATPTLTEAATTPPPTTPTITPTPKATEPTATTPTPTTTTTATPTATATPTITTPPAPTKPYGTITIASSTFYNDAMDPVSPFYTWANALYDPLITYDETAHYIGAVAESWTISPDGNTWTFKIRQGIKFHNGDMLTAEDVKFSVDRFGSDNSTNPWSHYLTTPYNKVSSAVIDDYTFQYVTDHPEPNPGGAFQQCTYNTKGLL